MQVKIITEADITDFAVFFQVHGQYIPEYELNVKILSGELIALGCFHDDILRGGALLSSRGHIEFFYAKEDPENRNPEKILFQEIHQICRDRLRLEHITVLAHKRDIAMYSYLGFSLTNTDAAASDEYPMQFPIQSQVSTPPPSQKNSMIIFGGVIGVIGLLSIASLVIFSIYFYNRLKTDRYESDNYYDSIYDSWEDENPYIYEDNYGYDDYSYDPDIDYGQYDFGGEDFNLEDFIYDNYGGEDYDFNFDDYPDEDDYPYEEEEELLPARYAADVSYFINGEEYVHIESNNNKQESFWIEYPQLEGLDSEFEEEINLLIKETAMQTAEMIYLNPSEELKQELERMAEEYYPYLESTVTYEIGYMDEDFISIIFQDHYFMGTIYHEFIDISTLNINLNDGTIYDVSDILDVDDAFTEMWMEIMLEEDPGNIALQNLDPALFTEMLQTGELMENRYYTNFLVCGEGVQMGLTYHYGDGSQIARGWVTATFPIESLVLWQKDCEVWDLITPVTRPGGMMQ